MHTQRQGSLAEIVIRRAPVNALTTADLRGLEEMIAAQGADPSVDVIALRAEGPGFSAGIDYKELQTPNMRDLLLGSGLTSRSLLATMGSCPVPIVAAVHGYCRGLGAAMVAACDFLLATEDASFSLPEGSWSAAYFSRLVPPMRMRQMAITGLAISARELERYGSVYRVTDADGLRPALYELAEALHAQGRQALVTSKAKLALLETVDVDRLFWQEQAVDLSQIGAPIGPDRGEH